MRMTKREDFDEAAAARPLLSWLETTWEERFVELKRYNSHCFQEVIEVRLSALPPKADIPNLPWVSIRRSCHASFLRTCQGILPSSM